MNLNPDHANGVRYANFNQDFTNVTVGSSRGCSIYELNPFLRRYYREEPEEGGFGYYLVEMLFQSSLMVLVRQQKPRALQFFNSNTETEICTLNYVTPILSVRMNRTRLAVVLETKIHLYNIQTMEFLFTIDTSPNPRGICAMSLTDESLIAYPRSANFSGDVVLFDGCRLDVVVVIPAHKSLLETLTFDSSGTLLATASAKGTIVRVFEVGEGSKIRRASRTQIDGGTELHADETITDQDGYCFRKSTIPSTITSLCFSSDSQTLYCTSVPATVHAWRIDRSNGLQRGFMSYMPTMISSMWTPEWPTLSFPIPNANRLLLGVGKNNRDVYILTDQGEFLLIRVEEGRPITIEQALLSDAAMINSSMSS